MGVEQDLLAILRLWPEGIPPGQYKLGDKYELLVAAQCVALRLLNYFGK